jgi:H+/Cl- antiporter ClcA
MKSHSSTLRDFTPLRDFNLTHRVWLISGLAIIVGIGGAALAVLLLRAIALMTNLFYYHRFSLQIVGPAGSPLGYWMVLVPVVGGIIVGIMARYGSDKIRGHGIPEAIEAILLNGARIEPRIAILKPISAAIAIGSGGPFGAEGPIIMTGGAFGSLLAQWVKLTDAERTTLLVAGAAAGMSATFAAPFAAVLLAVELLLFEWRPRSLVPVAFASVTAAVLRVIWLGAGPLFPLSTTAIPGGARFALLAAVLGGIVGLAAAAMSRMMYGFEDLFGKLSVHWMWWPAIGGLGVGIGGLFFPRGLGVGLRRYRLQIADVGLLPRLRHLRRRTGAAAHDWRFARCALGSSAPHAGRPTGTAGNGRHASRRARLPAHSHRLLHRAHTRAARPAAAHRRMHRRLHHHLAHHAALHPHGEAGPPRASPDTRIRRRSSGDGQRRRRHD